MVEKIAARVDPKSEADGSKYFSEGLGPKDALAGRLPDNPAQAGYTYIAGPSSFALARPAALVQAGALRSIFTYRLEAV